MADVPLTYVECALEAQRLLNATDDRDETEPELLVSKALVYASLAQAAAVREGRLGHG